VALSLKKSLQLSAVKHLSLLPLSGLLENIAGIYIPLLAGGSVTLLPAKEIGLSGSSQLNLKQLLASLNTYQPESLILIPELLRGLVLALRQGCVVPKSLKFIAVGGAKVATQLIQEAREKGLPIYEGYGLSECASVVCLNTPKQEVIGSVGKPLQHTDMYIRQGEIIVKQPIFLGYLNQVESWYPQELATGDLAYQDQHGFVHISGRKKNIIISSFGRNISPEWLESELLEYFSQAVVFGDQQPHCIALLSVTTNNDHPPQTLQKTIANINQELPDYAHIKQWLILEQPLSKQNGLLTATGKPKRKVIYQHYRTQITQLYAMHALLT
jgi:long-subunit acyl-CoA synthetase (AMP-forming)